MAVEAREDYGGDLLRRVGEGDEGALERLFDLHGATVWTFVLRVCGDLRQAREAAVVTFEQASAAGWDDAGAALLAAASRAAAARADEPVAAGRGVMPFVSLQERVRDCSLRLPTRQREVLALRALAGLSYEEMARIMDLNRAGVAQLIARARLSLAEELRGTPLAERAMSRPECARAVPLLAMRIDGELREARERQWLDEHLGGCETCEATRRALHEADLSYRAWLPAEPPASVRAAVTGFAAPPAAGPRFERRTFVPASSAPPRGRRRLTTLALLGAVLAGLVVFAIKLFATDTVAVPDPAPAVISAGAPVPTPEPYLPEVTLGEDTDGPEVSETAEETITKRARMVARRERRVLRQEQRLRRLARRRAAVERKRRARRARTEARTQKPTRAKPRPVKPQPRRRPAPQSVVGEAEEAVIEPGLTQPEPEPSPEPEGTPADSGG